MKPALVALTLIVLAALSAGCSDKAEATGPPEISYGRDICLECNMIISEPRFAAAYRLDDGEAKSFDGVGELVKHARRLDEFDRIALAWAHDYHTEDWILVDEAHFVAARDVATPMGHGIVAFTTMKDAEEFAAEYGANVMSWDEVRALPLTDEGLLGHHHHESDEMEDEDHMDEGSMSHSSDGDHHGEH